MKYRLRLLCAGLLFCSMQSAAAQETVQTLSPNGKLAITVSLQDGAPRYEVTYQGKPVVLESALGINGNGDWSRGMRIAGVTRSSRDTLWTPVYGERSEIPDRYNQSVIRFAHGKREPGLELEVRAYDEGAAFRYLFLEGGGYLHITGEATEFTLPEGTMAYFAPFAQAVHQKLPLHDWPGEADRPHPCRNAAPAPAARPPGPHRPPGPWSGPCAPASTAPALPPAPTAGPGLRPRARAGPCVRQDR